MNTRMNCFREFRKDKTFSFTLYTFLVVVLIITHIKKFLFLQVIIISQFNRWDQCQGFITHDKIYRIVIQSRSSNTPSPSYKTKLKDKRFSDKCSTL